VPSTTTSPSAPTGRRTGIATPVEVSLWVSAYTSIPWWGRGSGWVPKGLEMTSGWLRWGAAAAVANFEENSPKTRCWLRRSISEKTATSQNTLEPPLPRATS
jgi:hypothetical protein